MVPSQVLGMTCNLVGRTGPAGLPPFALAPGPVPELELELGPANALRFPLLTMMAFLSAQ